VARSDRGSLQLKNRRTVLELLRTTQKPSLSDLRERLVANILKRPATSLLVTAASFFAFQAFGSPFGGP